MNRGIVAKGREQCGDEKVKWREKYQRKCKKKLKTRER